MPHRSERFHAGDLIHPGARQYASVDVIRHKGAETGGQGYEILEFPHPPEGKKRAAFHIFSEDTGHTLFAFDTANEALDFDFDATVESAIKGLGPMPKRLTGIVEMLDDTLPWFIHPHVLIVDTPAGEAPAKIRNAWVGIKLPTKGRVQSVRQGVLMGCKGCRGYRVSGMDAMEALRQHNLAAANWWEHNFFHLHEVELIFDAKVCREI